MKKKKLKAKNKRHSDEPVGKLTLVDDFLPSPEELFPKEKVVKVTIALDASTIEFFKLQASKFSTKYQRMMREVLKGYASKYKP